MFPVPSISLRGFKYEHHRVWHHGRHRTHSTGFESRSNLEPGLCWVPLSTCPRPSRTEVKHHRFAGLLRRLNEPQQRRPTGYGHTVVDVRSRCPGLLPDLHSLGFLHDSPALGPQGWYLIPCPGCSWLWGRLPHLPSVCRVNPGLCALLSGPLLPPAAQCHWILALSLTGAAWFQLRRRPSSPRCDPRPPAPGSHVSSPPRELLRSPLSTGQDVPPFPSAGSG